MQPIPPQRLHQCLFMKKPLMRIPYTGSLPPPTIIPRFANTPTGAINALTKFLLSASTLPGAHLSSVDNTSTKKAVLLTGAGISVASGLADYRGTGGTYTLNRTYRPIYYNEFITNHEARKRYWARSFLGWTNLHKAKPNVAHMAVKDLGKLGVVSSVITQSRCSMHYLSVVSNGSGCMLHVECPQQQLIRSALSRCRFFPFYCAP